MKILMTGFEPFCGEKINPSQELLKIFSRDERVQTLLLPVSYERSFEFLQAELQRYRQQTGQDYDFILQCGQAGGRKQICLERVAINYIDADKSDEDGKLFLEREITPGVPPAYLSKLPLRLWLTELRAKGFAVEISNSAGAFVCNHLYFKTFEKIKTPALFLHVPYLTEQLMGKPADTFGMSLMAMKQTIEALLSLIERYSHANK